MSSVLKSSVVNASSEKHLQEEDIQSQILRNLSMNGGGKEEAICATCSFTVLLATCKSLSTNSACSSVNSSGCMGDVKKKM